MAVQKHCGARAGIALVRGNRTELAAILRDASLRDAPQDEGLRLHLDDEVVLLHLDGKGLGTIRTLHQFLAGLDLHVEFSRARFPRVAIRLA